MKAQFMERREDKLLSEFALITYAALTCSISYVLIELGLENSNGEALTWLN